MIQNPLTEKKHLSQVGDEIDHELGTQMIKEFEKLNPDSTLCFYIGRDILDQILLQPSCVGIQFIKALNKSNEETLVYVGVNNQGKAIVNISSVNNEGELDVRKGIVADHSFPWKRGKSADTSVDDSEIEWGLPE